MERQPLVPQDVDTTHQLEHEVEDCNLKIDRWFLGCKCVLRMRTSHQEIFFSLRRGLMRKSISSHVLNSLSMPLHGYGIELKRAQEGKEIIKYIPYTYVHIYMKSGLPYHKGLDVLVSVCRNLKKYTGMCDFNKHEDIKISRLVNGLNMDIKDNEELQSYAEKLCDLTTSMGRNTCSLLRSLLLLCKSSNVGESNTYYISPMVGSSKTPNLTSTRGKR